MEDMENLEDVSLDSCPNCQNHITKESLSGMLVCGACVELVGEERIKASGRVRVRITHIWRQKYIVRMKFEEADYVADLLKMTEGWRYEILCTDPRVPTLNPDRLRHTGVNHVATGDASTPLGIIADAIDAIQAHKAQRERGLQLEPRPAPTLMQFVPTANSGGAKD